MAPVSPFRRFLTLVILAGLAAVLFATRPRFSSNRSAEDVDPNTAGCLTNLKQISRAYALYALDYDGKVPRGVDPEDRFNSQTASNWRQQSGGLYNASQTPFLHEILRPYVASAEVFHCPADVGWAQTRLSQLDITGGTASFGMRDVRPSSFAKFGTSYYCWTKYGFDLSNAADIEDPAQKVLLFDGDLWHSNAGRDLINGLFADGHVQNLTLNQFRQFSDG
jgi:prepilin-type processing-associated H-X9-DG protein